MNESVAAFAFRFLEHAQLEFMLFALAVFLIVGFDQLVEDMIWMTRAVVRSLVRYRSRPPFSVDDLKQPEVTPKFAVMIAVWKEQLVIAETLRHALAAYEGHDVRIFVAHYSNDSETYRALREIDDERLILAKNRQAGPTTKGDNLNAAWSALQSFERQTGDRFDAFILHDAEDYVSRFEARIFSALLNRFSMIQLPVVPLVQPGSRWISGHYCDEFSESHVKTQVVREAIGAAIPSAGVGCMIRRDLMQRLAESRDGNPFDPDCLTEDYELGLKAREWGLRTAFVRIREPDRRQIVATHAPFPESLEAAIRQKSRWIVGIALAGWDRLGWAGGANERWMRARDRRTILEACAILAGYVAMLLYGAIVLLQPLGANSPALSGGVQWLLTFCGLLLLWRLLMRFACVTFVYGPIEGLMAIPRVVIANVIAILAARRAVFHYIRMQRRGCVEWEKTDHAPVRFPGA